MNQIKKIKAVGVMSGTSLDGLDIAVCEFWFSKKWNFKILRAETFKYEKNILHYLQTAKDLSSSNLIDLNNIYGKYIGKKVKNFLQGEIVDLIASHGHTIFHRPEKKITFQLGNGANIANETGITTISDFRTFDVALGGQGAPLVPIGDKLLFTDYKYCLNLGGFSNISEKNNKKIIAYDICPVNIVLNYYSQKLGKDFDFNGEFGKNGKANKKLIADLDNIDYYKQKSPKSLGREWVEDVFFPIIEKYDLSYIDKVASIYQHIANQISKNIKSSGKLLITGGGAKNIFLIDLIKSRLYNIDIIIPNNKLIDFKEALIFAFLGVLRINNQINVLSKVTGAKRDSISGNIFFMP